MTTVFYQCQNVTAPEEDKVCPTCGQLKKPHICGIYSEFPKIRCDECGSDKPYWQVELKGKEVTVKEMDFTLVAILREQEARYKK